MNTTRREVNVDSRRLTQVTQAVAAVVTIAAVAFLLLIGHVGPAVGVGAAGAVLVAFLAVIERRVIPARRGTLSAADRQHNLAVALKFGHVLVSIGLAGITGGAVLTVTGAGDDGVARVLLLSVGPCAIAAGLGMYTGYTVVRREVTRNGRSEAS